MACRCFVYPCEHGTTIAEHDRQGVLDNMPRCRDCRWWNERTPGVDGDCSLIRLADESDANASAVMMVSSESGLWGAFRTRADFGCVQWAAKDA